MVEDPEVHNDPAARESIKDGANISYIFNN
jgi:hypothetical protein